MKKTIIICGIIAGLISISMFIGLMIVGHEGHDWENGMLYGYTLMLLGFSFIFVATKLIRDKHNEGVMSFGQAFRIGLYITLIASTVYVGVWLIDYYVFMPDFMEKYTARALEKLQASGAAAAKIAAEKAEMDKFTAMYKNPFFNALITYTEILPVGLVVSLLNALILKRKRINTTASPA